MISKLAEVSSKAIINENVTIASFSTIYEDVTIGKGTTIHPKVTIYPGTTIGENCQIFPGAVIGIIPQDLKFNGENTTVEIGNNTIIRECVTIHRGTQDKWCTRIGDNCLLMTYVHIAHDCQIGNHVILASYTGISGHVVINDYAILEGKVAAQQFVEIGEHAFIGGGRVVLQDVPPYILAMGEPLKYAGINSIGLRRRHFPPNIRDVIKRIYKVIFKSQTNLSDSIELIKKEYGEHKETAVILDFIKNSNRGLI